MISTEIIKGLVNEELAKANEKFPMFASEHEAYAVIKEELEETADEIYIVSEAFDDYWKMVKENKETDKVLDAMKAYVLKGIQEAIQVAAMIEKAELSKEGH